MPPERYVGSPSPRSCLPITTHRQWLPYARHWPEILAHQPRPAESNGGLSKHWPLLRPRLIFLHSLEPQTSSTKASTSGTSKASSISLFIVSEKRKTLSNMLVLCGIRRFDIWAASWQNVQNGLCAQRRFRSAWASSQSDQSLCCALSG